MSKRCAPGPRIVIKGGLIPMFEASLRDGTLVMAGELSRDDVDELEWVLPNFLAAKPSDTLPLVIDCDDLEIADGMAMAALVRLLKIAVRGGGRFNIRRAGQMLAHNIYRAHLMDNGVTLIDTRMDEPST